MQKLEFSNSSPSTTCLLRFGTRSTKTEFRMLGLLIPIRTCPAELSYKLVRAVLFAVLLGFGAVAAAQGPENYRITWDDFSAGFTADSPDAKWFHFAFGPFVGDDGTVTISKRGLQVVAGGTNATTGEPAFVRTLAQEQENGGLPGALDHVKWLVYMNHLASTGLPGFDAVEGQVLACETWMGGRTFGTAGHPFGGNVLDPNDDLRLASIAMNTLDFETFMVYDFFLTNSSIYAFYERLPFGRTPSNNYAAFSYAIPVGVRTPGQQHHLKIAYDRAQGAVQWLVDDEALLSKNG